MLTQERLKQILHYNPLTGNFTWKVRTAQRVKIGDVAGSVNSHGYMRIRIDGRECGAHRLAWLYVYGQFPPEQIDHINHDKVDNRIVNLRCVSDVENKRNKTKSKNNTSGVTGVNWHKPAQKWLVRIKVNGKTLYLGLTPDFDLAVAMRKAAERKYNFHPNHGNL